MAQKISRRAVAQYAARQLQAGDTAVIKQIAAHLVETRRTRELELYVREIETALLETGVVVADVASARTLVDATKQSIAAYISELYSTKDVTLRETTNTDLIGGIHVRTADAEYDATIKRKLIKLQTMKV